ncbi:hypothetical protein ANO14919_033130 [Xylariales sp. No.14919]|nr:hypothetical protein ANO14919_033130 [Xylariales sp. No.14919]
MATPRSRLALRHDVLVFGPQFLSFTADSLAQLRSDCLDLPYLQEWVIQTLEELPHHWISIATEFSSLENLPGQQQLEDLVECIRSGKRLKTPFPLPNLVLCPLVVILQLTQYLRYKQTIQSQHNGIWPMAREVECVGFCTGLLSALAVACSTTQQEVEHYGAAAVRIAMLIGAAVDAENSLSEPGSKSVSFSVAWQTRDGRAELDRIIGGFPEAYISVVYDQNRATVTSLIKDKDLLCHQLKDSNITIMEIGLQGRFHDLARSSEVQSLTRFCDSRPEFALPNASHLVLPARYEGTGYITNGSLHEIALRAILVEQCQWYHAFTLIHSRVTDGEGSIMSFGLERCIPPSYVRSLGQRVVHMADVDTRNVRQSLGTNLAEDATKDYIAVIGMSCRVPGADDLDQFWKLLCENKSQHVEVPSDRFTFNTAWRDVDPRKKWFGNFVEDYDAFDNKFFTKSPREVAAMDPQQKMMLQAAYQAVEQSGYYQSPAIDNHIGCYVGVSNVDYQNNAACHSASAFTATGTLMSFVAGKLSHYFGWTGPSMSIDTACSGSAVAVNEACKAIISGECTSALAGGVNAMTSPLWYQNLAGASFLSPTGQCKPFDIKGDGYCRAEAVGAVFLKRLSAAITDGDNIFGVIAATAVHQNQNCTAITVPNSPSLSGLFSHVTSRAGIDPLEITVVEAHGTGTAVGDPAEYDAIRGALGGPKRSTTLSLASVKGLVGHAECASGIVALIKILLMINKGIIAPQASHDTINPALHASPSDKIDIPKQPKPWNAKFKAALINNYGASGSNASMVVTEAPTCRVARLGRSSASPGGLPQPFWFCAADALSLSAYASKFLSFLRSKTRDASLQSISFNVARQSNRSLDRVLIFSADSISDLEAKLESFCRGEHEAIELTKCTRPVILCFGGQVSTFVGLSREVFERTLVLRKYLDQCDLVCKSMGLHGIYPDIFEREPIEDTVQLQTCLFAMQYSCAKSWLDCGTQVSAIVGHSFGEIVAQTVAGALSLDDGLKVIARRARLIRDSWGPDRGAMLAVEADPEVLETLLAQANKSVSDTPATIACFNGANSFTIAGSTQSIESIERVLAESEASIISVRSKRLNTSHAFHSNLVEQLVPELMKLTEGITFSKPSIRVERATVIKSEAPLTSVYVAEHLRQPVYFYHAVQRLAGEFDDAIWLEAGSGSTVTRMASKALGRPKSSYFQEVNLASDDSWKRFTEATVSLWKRGIKVAFWPHYLSRGEQYPPLILPPYQFAKMKHFLELKTPQPATNAPREQELCGQPHGLWTFMGYNGDTKHAGRFRVETSHKTFQQLMAGHTVAHSQPICPSTLQLDIATEAICSLCPEYSLNADYQVDLRHLENTAPLCRDSSRIVWLDVEALDQSRRTWSWKMISNPSGGNDDRDRSLHASGMTIFRSRDDAEFLDEYRRLGRLVTHRHCREILDGSDSDDILQGSAIYKLFADVVDYSEVFRGVRKVVYRDGVSVGRVVKKYSGKTIVDAPLCDSFCQVAGVAVNCMTERPDSDAFISNGVHRLIRSPLIRDFEENPEVFDVLALHHRPTDRSYSSDVFIFDAHSSELLGVILGIQYQQVSKLSLSRLLERLTPDSKQPRRTDSLPAAIAKTSVLAREEAVLPPKQGTLKTTQPAGSEVSAKIITILSETIGIEPEEINDSTNLPDLGIDSLMGMEVTRELELAFHCTLDTASMMCLVNFGDLVKQVRRAVGEETGETGGSVHVEPRQRNHVNEGPSSAASPSTPVSTFGSEVMVEALSDTRPSSDTVSLAGQPDVTARQMAVDLFVAKYSCGFSSPSEAAKYSGSSSAVGNCVLITGATGSLGSHIVQHFAELPSTTNVVCFNRPSRLDPLTQQLRALEEKSICLDENGSTKLQVIASDTSKEFLGLDKTAYANLASKVTHIIHCAWPMSITRSLHDFEKQFATLRNLVDLASAASGRLAAGSKIGFQFVSSIATVGLYPVVTGRSAVPEDPSGVEYALPSGYSDAKLVCERLLFKTLGQCPDKINAMSVRVGQVAGSKKSGYWNPAEHFSLIVKSAQTLNSLPNLPGTLSWLPVEDVAATLADLVLSTDPSSAIYHVENPARQHWSEVIRLLSSELQIPSSNVIPYREWLDRVCNLSPGRDAENPAKRVMQFLEHDFLRMACGGLVLGTEKAVRVSESLGRAEPISQSTVKRYVDKWRSMEFLKGAE